MAELSINLKKSRFWWSFAIFLAFSAVITLSNHLAARVGGDENTLEMTISGILMGFLGIPIFSVILPLWLSRRWNLARSWLPRPGQWLLTLCLLGLSFMVGNFVSINMLLASDFSWLRFIVHFVSTMLFHIPYYPLFAILLFASARAWQGTWFAVIFTAAAFSLYHLAHFFFFPAGTTPIYLIGLFAAFAVDLLLYILTRALLPVALTHALSGAINMAAQGSYHSEVDFVFYLTIVIVSGVILYAFLDQRLMKTAGQSFESFWLKIKG